MPGLRGPAGLLPHHGRGDEGDPEERRRSRLHPACLKFEDPGQYVRQIRFGERYTVQWDDPDWADKLLITDPQ